MHYTSTSTSAAHKPNPTHTLSPVMYHFTALSTPFPHICFFPTRAPLVLSTLCRLWHQGANSLLDLILKKEFDEGTALLSLNDDVLATAHLYFSPMVYAKICVRVSQQLPSREEFGFGCGLNPENMELAGCARVRRGPFWGTAIIIFIGRGMTKPFFEPIAKFGHSNLTIEQLKSESMHLAPTCFLIDTIKDILSKRIDLPGICRLQSFSEYIEPSTVKQY